MGQCGSEYFAHWSCSCMKSRLQDMEELRRRQQRAGIRHKSRKVQENTKNNQARPTIEQG
jgi:hypothetical protein